MLIEALRNMRAPEPRPGFVDRVLANQTRTAGPVSIPSPPGRLGFLITRWDAWFGTLGAGAAAVLTLLLLKSLNPSVPNERAITLALHETRDIEVVVDTPRDLQDATIRIAVSGGIALNGFENQRQIDWQTTLKRGANLLSLPVVAREAGTGEVVAVIEHAGKTRRMVVSLTVNGTGVSRT